MPEYVKLSTAIVSPPGGNNPGITCSDSSNANTCDTSATPDMPLFGAFSSGVATGVNFAWDEVGVITLTPHVGDLDYQGTGDVVGTTSANIGRFTLGKFSMQNPLLDNRADICNNGLLISDGVTACSSFTYMGEEIDASFILVPMSLNNVASQNYVNSATAAINYAKLDPSVFANINMAAVDSTTAATPSYLTSRISNAGMPVVTCNTTPCFTQPGGTGSQAMAEVNVPFMLTRGVAADGPYNAVNIGVAPLDSDGAAVDATGLAGPGSCNNSTVVACYNLDANATAGNDHVLLGAVDFRYGRTRISSAYGSELLPLTLPVVMEYWDGVSYVSNVDDSVTPVTVTASNYLLNLSAGKTLLTQPAIASGLGPLVLSAPGLGNNGSVDLTAASLSYLPLMGSARATFGVYGGKNIFVYRGRRGR
jgi:MSHA biogenesis protein MshQ